MNEHATRVLDAYLDVDKLAVPHAVLIEGSWGSGKTFFLQKIYEPDRIRRIQAEERNHVPFLFVSLFGVSSASEVEMRIYKTACPAEAVAGTIAGTIALGIGEFLRVKDATKSAVEKIGKKAIKRLNDFVFVFDDLERVEKEAFGEVMGLVNSLIAEHGRKVILVTDETKLTKLIDTGIWKDQNEKIVGRRATIEADLASVIENSIKGQPGGAAKLLIGEHRDALLEIAQASKVKNLRNLSWAMHNAFAFADCLLADGDISKHHDHVAKTVDIVVATTLWMRAGLLSSEALGRLPGLSMTLAARSIGRNKEEPMAPQLQQAKDFSDTFASLPIDAPPIDYAFIQGFEQSGVLDREELNAWIKSQFGFGKEYKEPSWRRLWQSHERSIAETEQAIEDLKEELARRAYARYGEILQAAGLVIRQADAGDHSLVGNVDIVEFFQGYIDDVVGEDRLEQRQLDRFSTNFDSFGSLGFYSRETDEFQRILKYLVSKSQAAADENLQSRTEDILARAEAGDHDALFAFIRQDDYEFSTKPVLAKIPPERLVAFMAKDVPELNAGIKLLAYRYHYVGRNSPLFPEIEWARNVCTAVFAEIEKWPDPHNAMAIKSIQELIRHYDQDKEPEDMLLPPEEMKT
ncbi:P-loop NTPase fold protein [Rhizobium sp. BG4]|uniref:P-loop NTPase fold protein n=1 Tax=Rhizobium sp. BG4 TaxID=2613770 RepID=UPI00193EB658|nr:P-loop NTPase fold protein [Rhizobium sp. BG4]QRM44618.1 hypothetical protein F2982_14905 [Rhizobium sp. BG4]